MIFQENSFQFNKQNYLQTFRTAMGTKMAEAFANIFMREIEKQMLNESAHKPLAWKRYIDDIIFLCHTSREVAEKFIEQANKQHPTIRFTAEISCTDATFVDTTLYKGKDSATSQFSIGGHTRQHFFTGGGWRVTGSRCLVAGSGLLANFTIKHTKRSAISFSEC